jgi:enoyl-CoA hydratase/carnithine racemase
MSGPEFETILYEVDYGICTITLNRPERRNAYDSAMRKELLTAFDLTDADDAVRCVIVTGAGGNFCAGVDMSVGAKVFDPVARGDALADREEVAGLVRDGAGLVALRIFRSLKPVIGAIDGVAAGAGASISCAFDVRIASDDARYAFVFARRGLTPEGASTWFLPRLVGISTALEWFYSGRVIPAQEASEQGLVRSIYPASELLPAARALADEFVRNSATVSIALIRQMTWRALGMSHPMEAHRADTRAIRSRAASTDLHEGVAAFAERRQPDFSDSLRGGLPECFPEWIEPQFR